MTRYLRADCVIIASLAVTSIDVVSATRARADIFFQAGSSVNLSQDSIVLRFPVNGPLPYGGTTFQVGAAGQATAGGSVNFGRTRLSAAVTLDASEGEMLATTHAEAQAGWSDSFVIFAPDDNPGLAGLTGRAVFFFDIDGAVTATKSISQSPFNNPVSAGTSTQISMIGVTDISGGRFERFVEHSCTARDGGTACSNPPGLGLQSFEFDFIWGFPISIDVHSRVFASASTSFGGEEQAEASALFSDTFSWGGIGEVRDFSGNLVTGYRVESMSGVDWSRPVVCEPASALLFVPMGFLFIARRARRCDEEASVFGANAERTPSILR